MNRMAIISLTGTVRYENESESFSELLREAIDKISIYLGGTNLSDRNLPNFNFKGRNLCNSKMTYTILNGADLSGCNCSKVNFSHARLRGAKLRNTILRGADLSVADLSGADLSGADLSDVNLKGTNLSGVKGLLDPKDFLSNFETNENGIIAYKCFDEFYHPPFHWKIGGGSVLKEVPNMNRTSLCGCGINVANKRWISQNCVSDRVVWKGYIPWLALSTVVVPYHTDGKFRCGEFVLIQPIGCVYEI